MKKFLLLIPFILLSFSLYSQCSFTFSNSIIDESCIGSNDGSITVNPSGGIAPYQYALNGGAFQTSNIFNSLSEGDYTVYVSDASPCTDSVILHVNDIVAPGIMTLSSAPGTDNQTVCINQPIINIEYFIGGSGLYAIATGLPPGVTSSWTAGGLVISGGPSISGVFPYTVISSGPCTSVILTGTITILPDDTLLLISSLGTDNQTICEGASIMLISYVTFGSGTYNITGLPTGITSSIVGNQLALQGYIATSGVYNYTVDLVGGCSNPTLSGTITVVPIPNTTFSYPLSSYCLSGANPFPLIGGVAGSFSAAPSGLTINPATGEIDLSASVSGTYIISNTISAGCTSSSTYTITLNNPPSANFAYSSSSYCSSENDPIPIYSLGSYAGVFNSSPFGLIINSANGSVDLDLSLPGTYMVTNMIPAGGGCTAAVHSESITIHETPVLTDPVDQYLCNGSMSNAVNFISSVSGTSYNWSNTNPSIGISPTGSGNSIPSFLSVNTSSTTNTATILITPISPDLCYGTSQSFNINVSANDQLFYYPALVPCQASANPIVCTSGGIFSSSTGLTLNPSTGEIDLSTSTPGSYIVTYIISTPIPDTSNENFIVPLPIDAAFQYSQSSYCQSMVGMSNPIPSPINPGGMIGSLTSIPNGLVLGLFGAIDINGSNPTNYKIYNTISSYGMCPTIVDSINISIYPEVNMNASTITDDCLCYGSIEPHSSGGIGAKRYYKLPYIGPGLWDYSDSVVSSTAPYNLFNNLCPGTYSIIVKDMVGCTSEQIDTVNGLIQMSSQLNPSCNASTDGEFSFNYIVANPPPYTYVLNPIGTTLTSANTFEIFNNLAAGNYTLVASDPTGDSCIFQFTLIDPAILNITANTSGSICGIGGTISASTIGGTGSFTYTLNPLSMTNTSGIFSNLTTDTYTLNVTDSMGCTMNDTITVPGTALLTGVTVINTPYDESCFLAGDGSIDVSTSPSTGYFYLWNTGDTTQDIFNLISGNYLLKLSNASGDCLYVSDTITNLGLNCGTISGQVYIDSLSDCVFNIGDYPLGNIELTLSNGAIAYTNPNGEYLFSNVPYGGHTINQYIPYYIFTTSCIQPSSVTLNSISPITTNLNFSDSIHQSIDLGLFITSQNYVPGATRQIILHSYNNMIDSVQAKVTFVLNDSLNYVSATPIPTNITPTANGDSLTWILNVPPYSSMYNPIISIDVQTPSTYPFGLFIESCGDILPFASIDSNMTNNEYCIIKPTASSYDPNDKSVSPKGIDSIGGIYTNDSILDYTINFQNTGTSEAINIKILDTLSSNLNIHTFNVLSSSHPYNIEVLNGNILQFKFDNILLPDSNTNEALSHGSISYRIHQIPMLQLGDQIKNSASIYFDFNSPIITNTTLNTIIVPTSIVESIENEQMEIYPVPIINTLNLNFIPSRDDDIRVQLFDATGRCTLEQILKSKSSRKIDVHLIPSGIYLLKVYNSTSQFSKKVTIQH